LLFSERSNLEISKVKGHHLDLRLNQSFIHKSVIQKYQVLLSQQFCQEDCSAKAILSSKKVILSSSVNLFQLARLTACR